MEILRQGQIENDGRLSAVSVPDRTRRFVILAFAPHGVGSSLVIDSKAEVIAEWEAAPQGDNIVVEAGKTRELRLRRPGGPAVGGTAIVGIPQKVVARIACPGEQHSSIHPGDADIARRSGGNRREAMLSVADGGGDVNSRGPTCAGSG